MHNAHFACSIDYLGKKWGYKLPGMFKETCLLSNVVKRENTSTEKKGHYIT